MCICVLVHVCVYCNLMRMKYFKIRNENQIDLKTCINNLH